VTDVPPQRPRRSLRDYVCDIIDDMKRHGYPPLRFMQALSWPGVEDAELLERARSLLHNPRGQTSAWDYLRKHPDGQTLESVIIDHGLALGFTEQDVEVARFTLGRC
jgi:hypothetical protein